MPTTKELVGELIDVNQQMETLEQGSDIDIKNESIACRWHKSSFCYKTGEVKEWMKISNFQKMLGKMGLNAEAQEISQMEKIPVDVYRTKIEDGFVWVGMDSE